MLHVFLYLVLVLFTLYTYIAMYLVFLITLSLGPPYIYHYGTEIVALEGDKVHLICNATNKEDLTDPLQISWYNGTELLNSNGKSVIIYNKHNSTGEIYSVLLLDPVICTHGGQYICRAFTYPHCYAENRINLTVECKL